MQETYSPHNLSLKFDLDRATALRVLKDVEPDEEKTKGRPTYTIATFSDALQLHRARNASNANDGATADGVASLTQARVRIALANAEQKEHANAIRRGEYTANAAAVDLFGLAISTMREVCLNLPGKIADRISALRDDDQSQSEHRSVVFGILRDEIYAVLEILASPETYVSAGTAAAMSQPIQPVAPPTEGTTQPEGQTDVRQ